MFSKRNLGYVLVSIISFILGIVYIKTKKTHKNGKLKNKTVAVKKEDKHLLIFNSVVVLTQEVSEVQYNNFLQKFPSALADGNVIDDFSPPPAKRYTTINGKFYESAWDGKRYRTPVEMTRAEYEFETARIQNEKIKSEPINIESCEYSFL